MEAIAPGSSVPPKKGKLKLEKLKWSPNVLERLTGKLRRSSPVLAGGKIKTVRHKPGKLIRKGPKIKAVIRDSGEVIKISGKAQGNQKSSAESKKVSSKTNLQTSESGKIVKAVNSVGTSSGQGNIKPEREFGKEKEVNGNPPEPLKTEDIVDLKPMMSKSAVYKCTQCRTTHLDRNLLLKHASDCHGRKTYECPICQNLYTHHSNLRRHIKGSHKNDKNYNILIQNEIIKCVKCDLEFSSYLLLLEHKKSNHNLKLIKCPDCPNEYTDRSNMMRHRKSHGLPGMTYETKLPKVYETEAVKKKREESVLIATSKEEKDNKLEKFPVYVIGEGKGVSENIPNEAYQQLLEIVNKVRIQKEQNIEKDASFFLHLNRYDPSSI